MAPADPLRGQEPCREQAGIGHWGRSDKNMHLLVAILVSLVFVGCGDTVTSRFTDLQHAQKEHAFERGWLLPILPPSTRDITEKNDLDLNIGEGSFTFSAADLSYFITNGAEPIKINPASGSPQRKKQDEGFRFLKFLKDSTSWLIAVHPDGRGAYWVETQK